jgi:HD-like signal output (HDOD) protein
VSAHEIAQQIAADPALTAKVLRLANSAFFHASRTIGTVDDALRMLGFIMVRNLVLGNGMVAAFKSSRGMDLQQFWRHTLYTAVARWLAMHAGINGEDNGDAVFTVGMMHGIGQLQLHAVAPAAVAPLDKQCNVLDAGRAEQEKAAWGFHYADVSAELATIWHFPDALVTALRSVPDPLGAGRLDRCRLGAPGCVGCARDRAVTGGRGRWPPTRQPWARSWGWTRRGCRCWSSTPLTRPNAPCPRSRNWRRGWTRC